MHTQLTRSSVLDRNTRETRIHLELNLDGSGNCAIDTGIGFFDHMLTLMAVHGYFDLTVRAQGDLHVDFHHTVEDVGIVLGDAFDQALGDRAGIRRYGHASVPMDETLATVAVDLSRRPFLAFNVPPPQDPASHAFTIQLAKEFFRAFAVRAGATLHINVACGENMHHMIEAIFKATARALDAAVSPEERARGVVSSKGVL